MQTVSSNLTSPASPPTPPPTPSPRTIRKLPLSLVNRIAAGEVIERPASVVKELVENAIDAGSRSILIDIEDGGLSLIRVVDDGCGIPPEQLPLALAEHATSKLVDDDDLFRISTKGFRGEAVASIASVSHFRILSRTRTPDATAHEIESRGGQHTLVQAAAGNPGTTVEVRNLFFNTPARRKFMKGPSTEFGHISEMVLKLALPHPDIDFTLTHNARSSLRLPATTPELRLLEAWPDAFREQHLPVQLRDAEIHLTGVIGLPELAHPTAKYQYLYVNGRPIKDKTLSHALKEAYRGLTEPGRQPAAILLLTLPPEDVDVNVHPTKVEVRFKDSGRLHGLVMSGLREILLGNDLTPKAQPKSSLLSSQSDLEPVKDSRENLMRQLAEFFKAPPQHNQQLLDLPAPPTPPAQSQTPPESTVRVTGVPPVATSPSTDTTPTEPRTTGILPMSSPRGIGVPPMSVAPATDQSRHNTEDPNPQNGYPTTRSMGGPPMTLAPATPPPHFPPSPLPPSNLPSTLPALQIHNSYLVVETPEGLQIIDQHALHERILFEELLARITRGPLESQRLLIPAVLPASHRQADLIEQIRPLLERLGIDLAPAGPNQIAILGFPSFLSKLDPADFVASLLERGEQEILDLSQEELLHDVLDMMACKAAVKAGDPLTPRMIETLLAQRHLVDRSSNCPHGRPTTLKLSLRDLEKQFKRTGF